MVINTFPLCAGVSQEFRSSLLIPASTQDHIQGVLVAQKIMGTIKALEGGRLQNDLKSLDEN